MWDSFVDELTKISFEATVSPTEAMGTAAGGMLGALPGYSAGRQWTRGIRNPYFRASLMGASAAPGALGGALIGQEAGRRIERL